MKKYIDSEKLIAEVRRLNSLVSYENNDRHDEGLHDAYRAVINIVNSLQQEHPKKQLIQVKCLYPYDESWQKNKVYTCEVWHHGDLNHDFWDVYYDYEKDPRYVQFPSIELLNEEFVIINEEERPECSSSLIDIDAVREDFMTEVYHVLSSDPTNDRANAIIKAFDSLPTVSQEQPEVDLEEEILDWIGDEDSCKNGKWTWYECNKMIRHFYKRGLNARKEE